MRRASLIVLLSIVAVAVVAALTTAGLLAAPPAQEQPAPADMLGLSLVHTNRVLNRLARRELIDWQNGTLRLLNRKELTAIAGWEGLSDIKRPFI